MKRTPARGGPVRWWPLGKGRRDLTARALVLGLAVGAACACALRPGEMLFTREPAQGSRGDPTQGGPRITIARVDTDAPAGGDAGTVEAKTPHRGQGAGGDEAAARSAEPAPAVATPAATSTATAAADDTIGSPDSGYVLGEEDVIEIGIVGEPEFTKVPARIGPRGTVELPYAGEIQAAGLTVEQFRRVLEKRLNEYFVNPQVTVYLREYRSPMVHILGEVARPGPYKLTHSNTLMEVISRAGGFTQLAARGKVKVIRKTPGAPEKMFTVDAAAILEKGRVELDVALAPGDIIIVPESFL